MNVIDMMHKKAKRGQITGFFSIINDNGKILLTKLFLTILN